MAKRIYTYDDVNKAVKNVMGYMNSISNVWDKDRNLKLYDAFFKADELLEKYPRLKQENDGSDLYDAFCESEYEYFKDFMQDNNITDPRKYVGRTSTFYLTDLHGNSQVEVLETLLANIHGAIDLDFSDDLKVNPLTWSDYYTEDELKQDLQWQFEYIVKEFIYDVKEYMEDAVKVADYIDTFKNAQVDGLDEYMSCQQDSLFEADEYAKKQKIEDNIQAGVEAIQYTV